MSYKAQPRLKLLLEPNKPRLITFHIDPSSGKVVKINDKPCSVIEVTIPINKSRLKLQ